MVIAAEDATDALGAVQGDVSGLFALEETDTARTRWTKRGPLGCRAGITLARGRCRRVSLP